MTVLRAESGQIVVGICIVNLDVVIVVTGLVAGVERCIDSMGVGGCTDSEITGDRVLNPSAIVVADVEHGVNIGWRGLCAEIKGDGKVGIVAVAVIVLMQIYSDIIKP